MSIVWILSPELIPIRRGQAVCAAGLEVDWESGIQEEEVFACCARMIAGAG